MLEILEMLYGRYRRRKRTKPRAAAVTFYSKARISSHWGSVALERGSIVAHFADGERRFHAMVSRYFARS
jgi:hypothetical protein